MKCFLQVKVVNLSQYLFSLKLLLVITFICYSKLNAITLDNISTKSQNATTSTSWSHITGSTGSKTVLILSVVIDQNTINSVKYNGTNLTLFGSRTRNNLTSAIYYLTSPDTGTRSIQITISGGSANIRAGAITYFDVNQSAPLIDLYTIDAASGNANVTYTSNSGLAVVLLGTGSSNPNPSTTTQVYEVGNGHYDNFSTISTTGSANLKYTFAACDWLIIAGILNPYLAPLPVKLIDFNAHVYSNHVKLNWSTANEENLNRYEVVRSIDGRNFEVIG